MWLPLWLAGCAVEERVLLQVPIVAGPASTAALETADGGSLSLTRAEVTFVDLRLEEPPLETASLLEVLWPIPSAYAHPGHDYPGDVAGELLGTFTVDLLGPDTELGTAPCYSGPYATGRVHLSGAAALIEGTYTAPEGEPWPFSFSVAIEDEITGIPFEAEMSAEAPPDRVELRFDLAAALAHVDWGASDLDTDEIYHNTVTFGVVATPTWSLELVP